MFSTKSNLLNINFHFLYTHLVVLISPLSTRSKATYFASFCHLKQTMPAKINDHQCNLGPRPFIATMVDKIPWDTCVIA